MVQPSHPQGGSQSSIGGLSRHPRPLRLELVAGSSALACLLFGLALSPEAQGQSRGDIRFADELLLVQGPGTVDGPGPEEATRQEELTQPVQPDEEAEELVQPVQPAEAEPLEPENVALGEPEQEENQAGLEQWQQYGLYVLLSGVTLAIPHLLLELTEDSDDETTSQADPGEEEPTGPGEEPGTGEPGTEGNLTPRQQEVASTVNNACDEVRQIPEEERTSGQNDLLAVCDAAAEDPDPGTNYYDGLAPDEVAPQGQVSNQTMRQQMDNVSARMQELREGATGVSISGLSLNNNLLGGGASSDSDILAFSQWGAFVNGSVSQSRRDTSEAEPGFRRDSYGLTTGVDYRLTADTVVGAALGFTRTDTDLHDNAGKVDVDGYSLSLYGTSFLGDAFYLEGIATLGRNRYDTVRTVFREPIGTQSALAKPDGDEYGLGLNAGYDLSRGPWTTSFQASVDYLRGEIDGYTERPSHPDNLGAGSLLHIDSQTIETTTAEAAVQLAYASSQSWGVMHYSTRLGVEHEFDDRSRQIKAQFQEDPSNSTFSLRTGSLGRTYVNLGAGLTAQLPRGRAAYIFLETVEGRSGYNHYQVDVGFRMEF